MNASVLIVDDSLTVRMDLAEAFQAAGFRPVLCGSVQDARDALARETIDLAILDVVLPDGDGIELLEEIRRDGSTSRLPILMLSTEADVKDRIRGLQTGADDYVGKPYDAGYVVARGRELVLRGKDHAAERSTSILIVDDSLTLREELGRALVEGGYTVLTASSGEEGLRVAADRRPAAIIVDNLMPGIDGPTVIRRIRLDAALRGTPCLLLTGSEDAGAELRGLDAGADAFLRKDEDIAVILARLGAVLRSAGTARNRAESLAGPKRILVAHDEAEYLQHLASSLRGDGYDVVLARSGRQALEMLAVQTVDCILLDASIREPDSKEACREMKLAPGLRDVPLVMTAPSEDRATVVDALVAGADDFISTASGLDVLKARVHAQLRRKQFEDENRRVREELLRSELQASEERAARNVAETRAAFAEELERKNKELEAFSYSVSHDLRSPLRSIDGFSQALLEEYSDALDDTGRDYLRRVRAAAQRMGELIDDLLQLSRISSADLRRDPVSVSAVAQVVVGELRRKEPGRDVEVVVAEGLTAEADSRLLRVLFENLLGNAWKFTAKTARARVEIGVDAGGDVPVYFVRDNGAGFDMTYAKKLFTPFQRLHSEADFPGTGIGLATVRRIVDRHGGRVWAEGTPGRGATVFFTLPPASSRLQA